MKHFDYPRMWLYLAVFGIAFLGLQFCIPRGVGNEVETAYLLVVVGAWVAIRNTEDPPLT